MTKTFVRAALLGLAAIIATSSVAEASYGWRVAKIKNETSVDMYSVFIRRANFDSWGPDLLGDYVQTPGTRQTYKADGLIGCQFDVKVVFQDGDEAVFWNQDLCNHNRLDVTN